MTEKAQRHFQIIAMLNELDRAEQHVTPERFASAARIAARLVSNARNRSRDLARILTALLHDPSV
jgi:hypothetical protein